jgi:uncharacterized delta-60 repeat protein
MRQTTRLARAERVVAVRAAGVLAGFAIAVALGTPQASASPRDLDQQFGNAGKVITDIDDLDSPQGVAIDAQGRIVVAGWTGPSGEAFAPDFFVARYMPDGTLDPSFGTGGIARTDFGGGRSDRAAAVALDSAGRIVVAGTSQNTATSGGKFALAALARYLPNGSLDRSFGTNGRELTDLGAGDSEVNAMAIDSLGRIVVAGRRYRYHDMFNSYDFLVARFEADGGLDPSFGTGGTTTTDFGQIDIAHAVALDSQGRIVAAGESEFETASFVLARYTPDGMLDTSFADQGRAGASFPGDSYEDLAHAVTVDEQDRILAAGTAVGDSGSDFALARYDTGGNLDPSFGTSGTVTTSFTDYADAYALLVDDQGRIVAVGTNSTGPVAQFALARYGAEGYLDASFGTEGRVTTPFGRSKHAGATAAALDSRGRIVAVGSVSDGSTSDVALARYTGKDRTPPDVIVRGRSKFRTRHERRRAHFRIKSSEQVTFRCKVDGGRFHHCSSPYRTRKLGIGRHRLKVHATDAAGNTGTDKKRFRIATRR